MTSMAEDEHHRIETRAMRYALEAHADQRYGALPYIVHLAAVRTVLADFGFGGPLIIAAWLHDVLEDTSKDIGLDRTELAWQFGEIVHQLVWAVTGLGKNRKERNADACAKIKAYPASLPLKLADRIANCEHCQKTKNSDLLAMYRKEFGAFHEQLGHLDPARQELPAMWERCKLAIR
jgi:(p)ppGpp synthase/HD superfamily hydrolase